MQTKLHKNHSKSINDIIITKHTKSNESMLPSSCYLKILQYVKMKARKINNFNSFKIKLEFCLDK